MKLKVLFFMIFVSFNTLAMDEFSIAQTLSSLKSSQYMSVIDYNIKKIDADGPENGISIVFVVENNSIWTQESIISSHVDRIKKTLDSCGLKLKNTLTIKVSINNHSFNNLVASRSMLKPVVEVDLYPKETRFDYPTLFLLQKRVNYKTAKAFTKKSIKKAEMTKFNWANLVNTAWVTSNSESYLSTPNSTPSYSVLSHELGHIIGELRHVMTKAPNVLSASDFPNSHSHQLNAQQCQSIRSEQGF